MAWDVEYAAVRMVHRDDSEPAGAQPALWLAVRICPLPFVSDPSDALYYYRKPHDHILRLGNDSRACARAGGRNCWYDTLGIKYASGVLSSGGGGQTETGGR